MHYTLYSASQNRAAARLLLQTHALQACHSPRPRIARQARRGS